MTKTENYLYALFSVRRIFFLFRIKTLLSIYASEKEAVAKAALLNGKNKTCRHIVQRTRFINWF